MKVLILGGTRFMGGYLTEALLAEGSQVTLANRGTRETRSDVTNIICDRSQPGALEVLRDSNFDVVVDFSAYSSSWVEEAGNFFANKIEKYIFISTCAIYRSSNVFPITENFPKGPPHPFASYAKEKMRSEELLFELGSKSAFSTTFCRLPFVLGPGNYEDRESFVFSRLLANRPILLENGGKSLASFIFAQDVADAIIVIMNTKKNVNLQAFNISMPQATTNRGFVEIAAEVSGKTSNIISFNPGMFDLSILNFDLKNVSFPFPENNAYFIGESIEDILGFSPKKTLRDCLEIYLKYWLEIGDLEPRIYELESRILKSI